MARKRIFDVTGIERHVREETRPTLSLWCPCLKNGTRDIVFCLLKCPKSRIASCQEYLKIYPQLLNFEIDPKYIEKYGELTIPIPNALRKRRKRRAVVISDTE